MSLSEYVDDEEVKNMFAHADKDGNGYISYKEFTLMCKVPDQEVIPTEMPTNATSNGLSSIRYHSYITYALLRGDESKIGKSVRKCLELSKSVQKCPKVSHRVQKFPKLSKQCPKNNQKSPNNVLILFKTVHIEVSKSVQKNSKMCSRNI